MPISTWKTIWWAVLFSAVGGSVLFLLFAFQSWNAFPAKFMAWPFFTFPLVPVSIWHLRYYYRVEPLSGLGHWHLSMSDLIATSIFTGLLLLIYQCISKETFIVFGVPFSFVLGAGTLAGFTYAARAGITAWKLRCFAAFGFSLWSFGALGTGTLVAFLVIVAVIGDVSAPFWIIRDILDPYKTVNEWWLLLSFRLSLIAGPIGFICCHAANHIFKNSTPQSTPASEISHADAG